MQVPPLSTPQCIVVHQGLDTFVAFVLPTWGSQIKFVNCQHIKLPQAKLDGLSPKLCNACEQMVVFLGFRQSFFFLTYLEMQGIEPRIFCMPCLSLASIWQATIFS